MPRSLGRNVIANLATAAALIGTALISVPVILDHVGLAGYGVWTLALTAIAWITTAELGVGPAVQRFSAVAHGAGDARAVARLMWSTLAVYSLLGAVTGGAVALLAAPLVSLFDVSGALADDATAMFRVTGLAILLALVAAGLGNVQQGLERFIAFAAATAVGSLAFLGAAIVFLESDHGLRGLAWAALIQQSTMVALRLATLRDVIAAAPPGLVSRQERRPILSFAARLQMTVLSIVINSQTDKVVVGIVSSARTLGQVGLGSQVAEAGRLMAGAALSPMISRMSVAHGQADEERLAALFARLTRLWTLTVIGLTLVGVATLYPLIAGWLGDGYGDAALYGAFLVVAYGASLLTGTGSGYLRAIGRPSLEARFGVVLIASNVVGTVALGIAFGAIGVVAATTVAYLIGTAYFLTRLRALVPPGTLAEIGPLWRPFLGASVAAAGSLGWGLAMIELLPAGVALVPVALGAGAALAAYLSWATGVRPTPENVRALLA